MKPFLAILGGFAASMGLFVGGMVIATYMLTAEPVQRHAGLAHDVTDLWTNEPRLVDPEAQDLERLPPAPVSLGSGTEQADTQTRAGTGAALASTDLAAPARETDADGVIDYTSTGSVADWEGQAPANPADQQIVAAHLAWCEDRYRSYRPETNSYTPYSGGQRECVSPFSDGSVGIVSSETMVDAAPSSSPSIMQYASAEADGGAARMSSEHVQSCFERYRSYRPRDNTYQPYGGGPRRQCR